MSESLENNTKWRGLLKTSDTEPLSGSERPITDGEGNASGLGLSQTRVWLYNPNVKNISQGNTQSSVLVIDSNGNVFKRPANSRTFNVNTVYDRLIAKTTGNQETPLSFSAIGSGDSQSISLGQNVIFNTGLNGVIIEGLNKRVNIRLEARVQFEEVDAEGQLLIKKNGTTVKTLNVINIFQSLNAENVYTLSFPYTTETEEDEITIEASSTSGQINVLADSLLDVEILD